MNFINWWRPRFRTGQMIFNWPNLPNTPPEAMRAYYDTIYNIPSKCQNRLLPNNSISDKFGHYSPFCFKSGSKNGKHGWVPSVMSIAAASNIGVQLFQQVYRNQFWIFHESPGSPRIKKYTLIESSFFLFTLSNLPKLALGGTLQLSDPDYIFLGKLMFLK